MARALGEEAVSVPAVLFCGEMHVGWGMTRPPAPRYASASTPAVRVRSAAVAAVLALRPTRNPARCRNQSAADRRAESGQPLAAGADPGTGRARRLQSCAFFVLLFLLSMMAHQKSRARMLLIGGVFVAISGLMYFAFMAPGSMSSSSSATSPG